MSRQIHGRVRPHSAALLPLPLARNGSHVARFCSIQTFQKTSASSTSHTSRESTPLRCDSLTPSTPQRFVWCPMHDIFCQ
eukprot:1159097-Pelagomonas_calceolata.AAC.4